MPAHPPLHPAATGVVDPQLAALLVEHWEAQMETSPLWATELGDHRFDDRLGDASPGAHAAWMEREGGWLARAREMEGLQGEDATTRALPGADLPNVGAATTLATTPAVGVARNAEPGRRWIRDTISTRAVGPLVIEALPTAELEALEMDCGGVTGEFLQQVRRGMEISLQDIADRTKIGISALRYIEADNIDRLPARVYLKGYLNQICRLLHLPTPQIPERYLERHGL